MGWLYNTSSWCDSFRDFTHATLISSPPPKWSPPHQLQRRCLARGFNIFSISIYEHNGFKLEVYHRQAQCRIKLAERSIGHDLAWLSSFLGKLNFIISWLIHNCHQGGSLPNWLTFIFKDEFKSDTKLSTLSLLGIWPGHPGPSQTSWKTYGKP